MMIRMKLFSRRGMVMFFALFTVLLLGILALWFHKMSLHGQAMAFRFEKGELVRNIADSTADEVFMRVSKQVVQTPNVSNALFAWLLNRDSQAFTFAVPLMTEEFQAMAGGGVTASLSAFLRHVDFRATDSKGNTYGEREGVGTLEIRVIAELWLGNRILAGCAMTRHHDFKIVAIVSPRNNQLQRTRYDQNFVLDYALLVRNGLGEFRKDLGCSLNHDQVRLVLAQDQLLPAKRGKVYFGGTAEPGGPSSAGMMTPRQNVVFLNISERFTGFIPPFAQDEIKRANLDECCELFPALKANKSKLTGLEGVFGARHEPLVKDPGRYAPGQLSEVELKAKKGIQAAVSGAEANLYPGLELFGADPVKAMDPAYADSIFEGALRQRFLYFVHFYLDLSKVSKATVAQISELQKISSRMPCTPPPLSPANDTEAEHFFKGLLKLNQARPENTPPLISSLTSDFLYKGGQTGWRAPESAAFARPVFFNFQNQIISETATGKLGFKPFRHINLYSRRLGTATDLERLGILDRVSGRLILHGITTIDSPLELGETMVEGQGVLIARGIRLKGKLKRKNPDDLCILYSQNNNIEIETSEEIEASLIAHSDLLNSSILGRKPFNVRGAFSTDVLDPTRFAGGGPNTLSYDPALKVDQPRYHIGLSRWISFQRITESAE